MSEQYDSYDIMELLPHRYPFLLVDRVTSLTPWKSVEAYKNVTIGEPYFSGHFPGRPVMPGVLMVEGLAQAAGLLLYLSSRHECPPEIGLSIADLAGRIAYFTGLDKVRFRRRVYPGDRLDFKVEFVRIGHRFCKVKGWAEVDGELAVEAEMMSALAED